MSAETSSAVDAVSTRGVATIAQSSRLSASVELNAGQRP
jgi:hypothetical protein